MNVFRIVFVCFTIFIIGSLKVTTVDASEHVDIEGYTDISHSDISVSFDNLNDPNKLKWAPFDKSNLLKEQDGTFWIHIPITHLDIQHQDQLRLLVYPSPSYFEVYQSNKLIHHVEDVNEKDPITKVSRWHIVTLTDASEDVYIRMKGSIPEHYIAGTESQIIGYLLKTDMIDLISIIGFFVIGLLTLLLYLYNPKFRILIYYAFFIIIHFSVWPLFTYTHTSQLFFQISKTTQFYITVTGQVLSIALLLLLLREIIEERYRTLVKSFIFGYLAVGFIGIIVTYFYNQFVNVLFPTLSIFILINIILALFVSICSLKRQKNIELIIFLSGLIVFILLEISLNLSVTGELTKLVHFIKMIRPFSIVLPGAFIIINRYREADRQVKEYADNLQQLSKKLEEHNIHLEQRVAERTGELKEANRQLEESIQERMAAAVEISALEERNRIAQEIHDIVGHTLTTTIVQIEAGKRLIIKKPEQAIERMETSQKLIRKGLDEIRISVRLLKESEWNYDLQQALQHTIEESKNYAGVQINSSIKRLPSLSMIQKNVIYMALKEGITNGIKHGGARRFYFSLERENGMMTFQLKNNGTSYEQQDFGFGLATMQKRVESLQGKVQILHDNEWNFILDIRFPIVEG
ncbi:signal transduction histidine kinase [Metabacillus malikii]|uniref:histidine kinase n=2 Tax=Metabacillus malikii TaxID=1504265 RepID=A0ABT9ZDJ4_9BACI|nr:signal transduction histidine kinase [Metabacillus malikii]